MPEKEKIFNILTLDYMSSEDTGSESGSGLEMATRHKVFLSRPLLWRSTEANNIMESLDRKTTRRRSDRAKEMCRTRRVGLPSDRAAPDEASSFWTIADNDN